MNIGGHEIGVCSWSLQAAEMGELVSRVRETGLDAVQLALGPLLFLDDKRKHQQLGVLRESGLKLLSGMISFPGEDYSTIAAIHDTGGLVPDKDWPLRRRMTVDAGKVAAELGITGLSTHVGFIPPSNQERYAVMIDRVKTVADELAEAGLNFLLETGQERASELLQFLNDLPSRNVRVNFDPANMILYGAGDPLEAIKTLGRHIGQVHIKDATLSDKPGTNWGEEVPFGQGQVGPRAFLEALQSIGYRGPLVIEREAGENRIADVRAAVEALRSLA
jgi:sugar phosphate isomerase/epimerase